MIRLRPQKHVWDTFVDNRPQSHKALTMTTEWIDEARRVKVYCQYFVARALELFLGLPLRP